MCYTKLVCLDLWVRGENRLLAALNVGYMLEPFGDIFAALNVG
jgi:hypothetical protein